MTVPFCCKEYQWVTKRRGNSVRHTCDKSGPGAKRDGRAPNFAAPCAVQGGGGTKERGPADRPPVSCLERRLHQKPAYKTFGDMVLFQRKSLTRSNPGRFGELSRRGEPRSPSGSCQPSSSFAGQTAGQGVADSLLASARGPQGSTGRQGRGPGGGLAGRGTVRNRRPGLERRLLASPAVESGWRRGFLRTPMTPGGLLAKVPGIRRFPRDSTPSFVNCADAEWTATARSGLGRSGRGNPASCHEAAARRTRAME